MKKISAFLVGAGLMASTALAASVSSVNMVGFVNQDLQSNTFHFAAIQMPAVGGTNQDFTTVIGDQLPVSSLVYFWNSTSQIWAKATKTTKGGWGAFTNRQVSVGEGVFIKSPSNMTVNLAGEVPLAPTSTVSLVTGYNALGYMYPVDTPFTNSALYDGLPASSMLNVWSDNGGGAWIKYTKTTKGGWGAATNLVLHAGQGFFVIKSGAATNLFEVRPFTP